MTARSLPLVMGVLNVTPDSFSDGGRWADAEDAVVHGLRLAADGADVVDVGGESTRPGATRPPPEEERRRVLPVVRALVDAGVRVSVDTMRAEVAEAALEAGAQLVNDVSGGLADPRMLDVVAASEATYIAMHWRGHGDRMDELTRYDGPGGVVGEVCRALARRVEAAVGAGIDPARLVLDPGLGFAKSPEHNWALLGSWELLDALGLPVLVGASRKRFLGALLAGPDGTPRPVDERETAHATLVALLSLRGVWGARVHDVRATRDALAVVARLAPRPVAERRPAGAGQGSGEAAAGSAPATETDGADGMDGARGAGAPPRDEISVSGIECFAHHGVLEHERRDGQPFLVDLVVGLDTRPAAASDDLHDTVDYGSLVTSVKAAVERDPVDLLETLATRLADTALLGARVEWCRVTVHKPHAPIDASFSDVSLTITRTARPL